MASPITMGGPRMSTPLSQQQPGTAIPNEAEETGLQIRPMGLKVHYTFDKDSCVNCLARWPQILNVQTMPIDETNWIGIVDLRICVQAIAQGSPELLSRSENDYAIYAFDYSEPDTPLVGQGMLSWALDPSTVSAAGPMENYSNKMVTGRVTKNMLALFGNGVRETLEVKLKLTEVARMMRPDCTGSMDTTSNYARQAPTPTDATEWNSFLQANPNLGRSVSVSAMPSPSLAPARPYMSAFQANTANDPSCSFDANARPMNGPISQPGSRPGSRQSSAPPYQNARAPQPLMPSRLSPAAFATASPPPSSATQNDLVSASTPPAKVTARPARPPRRSRSKVPTGRPRGRPRKSQPIDGNTSAAEEIQTDADADDTQKKKRAKTTKADYPMHTSLDAPPESLRVHASTSGSLRTLRPVSAAPVPGSESNAAPTSHLQELPRAPTPIPQGGGPPSQYHARKMLAQKARRESLADYDSSNFQDHMYARSMDARSPTDSMAPSPENYTPEDSPADMGSSPPVPRSATYVPQSSPMPSSPILPPMPRQQPDSGFMSGGIDDLFEDYDCANDALQPPLSFQEPTGPTSALSHSQAPSPTDVSVGLPPVTSSAAPPRPSSQPPPRKSNARSTEQYEFLPMNPGPPELLPVTSIYNPPPPPKTRSSKAQGAATAGGKPPAPTSQRSNSEPAQRVPQQQPQSTQQAPAVTPETDQAMSSRSSAPAELPAPAGTQPSGYELPMPNTASAMPADIREDVGELAKLIAASNECAQATTAPISSSGTTFTSERSGLEATAQGHGQQQPTLPQQPAEAVSRATGSVVVDAPKIASGGNQVPASDPPALPPLTLPSAPPAPTSFSEAPCPPSDAEPLTLTKNLVRKAAIRERLQKAIDSGEMPPFCQNCGAIETPTWRKMWTQDHHGEPRCGELSERPGFVTAIDILERDDEGKTTRYRLVKKTLGPAEDNKLWTEMLLCNPCGIWLGKFKKHRPSDRWDKDASRLNQPRRKGSRSKKARTKSESEFQPTSEAYFPTDPAGPMELDETGASRRAPSSTATAEPRSEQQFGSQLLAPAGTLAQVELSGAATQSTVPEQSDHTQTGQPFQAGSNPGPALSGDSASRRGLGSVHSRGSGTANSPISVDDHFGATRRLLFPSPRKDGVPKVLGELAANVVSTTAADQLAGEDIQLVDSADMSNQRKRKGGVAECEQDDMVDLFGTPPQVMRVSTPPPGDNRMPGPPTTPFKTPTRTTPSHRPITRSISKSIRCVSNPKSPAQAVLLQRTPSKAPGKTPLKTPRSVRNSASRRRVASMTPGHQQAMISAFQLDGITFEAPFASTLNQLLSEANEFTTGSPSHGLADLDLSNLDSLDSLHDSTAGIDFGSYYDTDLLMPSSSPLLGRKGAGRQQHVSFGGSLTFDASDALWTDFSEANFSLEETS